MDSILHLLVPRSDQFDTIGHKISFEEQSLEDDGFSPFADVLRVSLTDPFMNDAWPALCF